MSEESMKNQLLTKYNATISETKKEDLSSKKLTKEHKK